MTQEKKALHIIAAYFCAAFLIAAALTSCSTTAPAHRAGTGKGPKPPVNKPTYYTDGPTTSDRRQ